MQQLELESQKWDTPAADAATTDATAVWMDRCEG